MALKKTEIYLELFSDILNALALKKIYKLNYAVTTRCNSRCITCNIWKSTNNNAHSDELSLEEIKKIFSSIGDTIVWLSITGGEPFLKPNIKKIIECALSSMPRLKVISFVSNGLATSEIVKTIEELLGLNIPLFYIKFSVDGPEEIHNKIRGIENAFNKTLETYRRTKQLCAGHSNTHIGLETTLSKFNVSQLDEFIAKTLSSKEDLTITIAHNSFFYNNENEDLVSPVEFLDNVKKIVGLVKKNKNPLNPTELIQRIYLENIPRFLSGTGNTPYRCMALSSSFALNHCGEVYPCLMWNRPLGNALAYDYNVRKILQSPYALESRSLIAGGKCPLCWTPCEAYQNIFNRLISPFIFPIYLKNKFTRHGQCSS